MLSVFLIFMTDKISQLFEVCQQSYLRHNVRIQLPANTDPTKTYQWRYLKSLDKKFSQWGFDQDLEKRFIDITIDYCFENKLTKKGLAIFHQTNLMEMCYNKLVSESKNIENNIITLKNTHQWLKSQVGSKPLSNLLLRDLPWEYCNLTKWYLASKIPMLYLAISNVCKHALTKLQEQNSDERRLLPTHTKLFLMCSQKNLDKSILNLVNSW